MADDSNLIHFIPALRVVEQAPAGRHFGPVEALPVELDGSRVLIRGRHFRTFMSVSNAARVASALMTLENFGLLDCVVSQ